MSWLSSIVKGLTGQAGRDEAQFAGANSQFAPYNINLPGMSVNYAAPGTGYGDTGSVQTQLSPEYDALRQGFLGLLGQNFQAMDPSAYPSGYRHLSPEVYGEGQNVNSSIAALGGGPQFNPNMIPYLTSLGLAGSLVGSQMGGTPGNVPNQRIRNVSPGYANFFNSGAMDQYGRGSDVNIGPVGNYDQFFNDTYNSKLTALRNADRPYDERFMAGGMDSQFAKGILASTAGQYQTEGMMNALNTKDLQRQSQVFDFSKGLTDQAYNTALTSRSQDIGRQMGYFGLGSQFGGQGLGANELGINRDVASGNFGLARSGLLNTFNNDALSRQLAALSNYNNRADTGFNQQNTTWQNAMTNDQVAGTRMADRFNRVSQMFGLGLGAAGQDQGYLTDNLNNVGSFDSFIANLMQIGSNMGAQRSNANINAWSPSVRAGMQTDSFAQDFIQNLIKGVWPSFGGTGGSG